MTAPMVGFIGLGAMGRRMATRLLQHGFDVVVHNRTRDLEAPLVALGARPAPTPADVAAEIDLVLSCLLHDDAVTDVFCGPGGLVAASRPGMVFVEHATFSPALAQRIAAELDARGASFVDAPVSGGPEGADAGTLSVMAGGSKTAVQQAAAAMDAYAARVIRVGPVGAGMALKLVNQLLVTCHVAAAAEAEQLLQQLDVTLDDASAVLSASWGDSAMLRRLLAERSKAERGPSEATIGGLREPQRLLAELAAAHDLDLPITTCSVGLFAQACAEGRSSDDLVDLLAGSSR